MAFAWRSKGREWSHKNSSETLYKVVEASTLAQRSSLLRPNVLEAFTRSMLMPFVAPDLPERLLTTVLLRIDYGRESRFHGKCLISNCP